MSTWKQGVKAFLALTLEGAEHTHLHFKCWYNGGTCPFQALHLSWSEEKKVNKSWEAQLIHPFPHWVWYHHHLIFFGGQTHHDMVVMSPFESVITDYLLYLCARSDSRQTRSSLSRCQSAEPWTDNTRSPVSITPSLPKQGPAQTVFHGGKSSGWITC